MEECSCAQHTFHKTALASKRCRHSWNPFTCCAHVPHVVYFRPQYSARSCLGEAAQTTEVCLGQQLVAMADHMITTYREKAEKWVQQVGACAGKILLVQQLY